MHIYNQENRKGKGKWKSHLGSISPSPSHSARSSSPSPPLLPPLFSRVLPWPIGVTGESLSFSSSFCPS